MKSKKILSGLLAAALAFGTTAALPTDFADIAVTASAAKKTTTADGFVLKVDKDGYTYVSDYKGKGGDITIPKEAAYVKEAFSDNDDITSVTIPETCYICIGNSAFYKCDNLKKVVFEGDIGYIDAAFAGCSSLEEVVFKGNIHSDDTRKPYVHSPGIGSSAFAYCTNLKKVTFEKPNAVVDSIGSRAFENCMSLTSIDLPTGLGVIEGDAFKNCVNLTSVNLPAGVELDYGVFCNCFSLQTLTVPADTKFKSTKKTDGGCFGYGVGSESEYDFYHAALVPTGKMDGKTTFWIDVGGYDAPKAKSFTPAAPTMIVTKGSDAETYCKNNDIKYKYASGSSSSSSSSSSSKSTSTSTSSKLAAPTGIKASKTASSVTLKWNKVEGAERYRVYIYNSSTGKYEKYRSVTGTSCTVSGLKSGTKYKFKLVAVETKNGSYVNGKAKAFSVTTK